MSLSLLVIAAVLAVIFVVLLVMANSLSLISIVFVAIFVELLIIEFEFVATVIDREFKSEVLLEIFDVIELTVVVRFVILV